MAGFNIFSALARGAEGAINHRVAQRDEQRRYELMRSRALAEELERRNLALQYGEEDYGIGRTREQQEYDLGLQREQGEYDTKYSRALAEGKDRRNLALQYDKEDYDRKLIREAAERDRKIGVGHLMANALNNPLYAFQTTAKAHGTPDILGVEQHQARLDTERARLAQYNNRALGTPDSSAQQDLPLLRERLKVLQDRLKTLMGEKQFREDNIPEGLEKKTGFRAWWNKETVTQEEVEAREAEIEQAMKEIAALQEQIGGVERERDQLTKQSHSVSQDISSKIKAMGAKRMSTSTKYKEAKSRIGRILGYKS